MNKRIFISILACLIITLISTTAFAQDDVLIKPYRWDETTPVSSSQYIYLSAGWTACRRGAVQDFLTATHISWLLVDEGGNSVDEGEDTNEYWGPIYQVPVNDTSESACMGMAPETVPTTEWLYPLGYLEPGDYTLTFDWWLDHPITDVADYDGDGRPDVFREMPGNYPVSITIHVVE